MTDDSQQSAYDDQHLEARREQDKALRQAALTRNRVLQVAMTAQSIALANLAEFWKNILKPKDDKPDE